MSCWQILSGIVALSQIPTMPSFSEAYPWRGQYALETPNKELHGGADLEISGYSFKPSDRIRIDLRFEDWSGHGTVYFEFGGSLPPAAVALAVYNDKHEYVGQYYRAEGSHSDIRRDAFVEVREGEYLGKRFDWGAGMVSGAGVEELPPGRYYVQAIFFYAFILVDSRTKQLYKPSQIDAFNDHFDRTELFRSNTVEIRILPEQ